MKEISIKARSTTMVPFCVSVAYEIRKLRQRNIRKNEMK